MKAALRSLIASELPHLSRLLGEGALEDREAELERLGMPLLWRVEQDLAMLAERHPTAEVDRAYRDLLRNLGQFVEAAYEIRVSAMLAPWVDRLELAPRVGLGRCDLAFELQSVRVWVEVTVRRDLFPRALFTELRCPGGFVEEERLTVERSFDPTSGAAPHIRKTPASQDLRGRIHDKLRLLPGGVPTLLVVGTPYGHSGDVEEALEGDEVAKHSGGRWWREHVGNGLFALEEEAGGVPVLGGLVWLRLIPHFSDIRVQGRFYPNPRAAHPLPSEVQALLRQLFDRAAVLRAELERIREILSDRYHPRRLIVFGSLADELAGRAERVHEWSDLDLAVVQDTPRRPAERIREVLDLVQPRVSLNVLVFTPEEFERARLEGNAFVRDEILAKGNVLLPADE